MPQPPPAGLTSSPLDSKTSTAAFWQILTHFDSTKLNPNQALRNSIGVVLPIIIGYALGMPRGGLAIASGALFVSYSDGSDPYAARAKRMLSSAFWCSLAVFLGAISGRNNIAAIAVATLWAFPAGLLVCLGTTAADLGTISLVSLVIYSAQALPAHQAAFSGILSLAGGLLQTGLSIALWPVQRYAPERRTLAALFRGLARIAEAPMQVTSAPSESLSSTQAQEALSGLGADQSLESFRYLSLLNQAERIRLSLLMLARLRLRMFREDPFHFGVDILDKFLAETIPILDYLSNALNLNTSSINEVIKLHLDELEKLTQQIRQHVKNSSTSFINATARDARFQMDALAGQLRSALDLVSRTTPAGSMTVAQQEGRQPFYLRYTGKLATLRANLNPSSTAFLHAMRLTLCIALGEIISREISLRRSYWLPMTIALVLKPEFTTTFTRGLLRIAGTLVGLMLTTLLFHLFPASMVFEIILIFILTFLLRWVGPTNYGIFAVAISAFVVSFIAINGIAPQQVIVARGVNTAAGGAIALIAYLLWPAWERTRVSELIAKLLDAYREYFHAVADAYFNPESIDTRELDRARLESRRSRSNLEASIERLNAEPGTTLEQIRQLRALLASTHRFAHATMALDAARLQLPAAPARQAFQVFAQQVETTLALLTATLRGTRDGSTEWPDLREAYLTLAQTGDPAKQRYALTNAEADRITNSLNTLREHVLARSSEPQPYPASTALPDAS
jgi:uncharacterized membrane protein YccC